MAPPERPFTSNTRPRPAHPSPTSFDPGDCPARLEVEAPERVSEHNRSNDGMITARRSTRLNEETSVLVPRPKQRAPYGSGPRVIDPSVPRNPVGRPRKVPKNPVGRPRKTPLESISKDTVPAPKRPRGRPRKPRPDIDEAATLDEFVGEFTGPDNPVQDEADAYQVSAGRSPPAIERDDSGRPPKKHRGCPRQVAQDNVSEPASPRPNASFEGEFDWFVSAQDEANGADTQEAFASAIRAQLAALQEVNTQAIAKAARDRADMDALRDQLAQAIAEAAHERAEADRLRDQLAALTNS
ncbi:hypothetical protein B0I35DRAFT_404882 [Stachybotrys elegans]|uniref:AT hook domain-containing protein n=1 Tax=Stachybotrys elegans TaxID=80388 RepID=A0A8K0WXX9_9HYPO|nr:hypothetical protein B0I35DRAFT_404882 [Stachybotrys elegans]